MLYLNIITSGKRRRKSLHGAVVRTNSETWAFRYVPKKDASESDFSEAKRFFQLLGIGPDLLV